MAPQKISIEETETSLRLDQLLSQRFTEYSRTYFQELIENQRVLLNGQGCKKRMRPKAGDLVEVFFKARPPMTVTPQAISLDIVYEDSHLLIINKPAGMVVHPAPGNWTDTFANALLSHCQIPSEEGDLRPGIVHRLDKDTSGLLIGAKNPQVHLKLVELFASRRIHKEYLAICIGKVEEGIIEAPIGRHPVDRKKMAVSYEKGKQAITQVQLLAFNGKFSKARLYPKTGRTHQIRVHMQMQKTPILGDSVYGIDSVNKQYRTTRHFLHAEKLRFQHPMTGQLIEVVAELPKDMHEAFLCAF